MQSDSPIRPYRVIVQDSNDPGYTNTLLVGTATTGLLRVEWVAARYGQVTPLNWSLAGYMQTVAGGVLDFMPLRYLVADAQNLIVAEAIRLDMEWLFLLEHDVILPPGAFIGLGCLIAIKNVLDARAKRRREAKPATITPAEVPG